MKTLLLFAFVLMGISASAQTNHPKAHVTGSLTGTENISGTNATTIQPMSHPEGNPATTASGSHNNNSGVITTYGRNNDGSSTGTTVTGNGSRSDSAAVDDNLPSPANRGGTMIATPRGR